MATALIQVPDKALQQIATKHADLLQQAQQLIVRDDASYRSAGELALGIAGVIKEIHAACDPVCDAAHKAHKAACAMRSKLLDECAGPDRIVRQKLGAYAAEQERRRQDAEREAIAAARVKAEEEVIQRASDAYERGERSLAERILNGPVIPEAVAPVTIAKPQAAGVAMVSVTRFQITDANLIPREFMSPDEKKIRGYVNTFGAEAVIAGVRIWAEQQPRIGGRIAEPKPAQSEPKPVQSVPVPEAEEAAENIW